MRKIILLIILSSMCVGNMAVIHGAGLGHEVSDILFAAEQGDVEAQNDLGVMYDHGNGVEQDYNEALSWYQQAAEQGHAEAQYNLGDMYKRGEGVKKNYIYSYMWYSVAASSAKDVLLADVAKDRRSRVARKMTSSQIEKAQELAMECVRKEYKDC